MTNKCKDCKFYDFIDIDLITGDNIGDCKYYPPIATVGFASVADHDWCGQFDRKEKDESTR